MNEERKYSNNNIFANNGVDDNNQNNIAPNDSPTQINSSLPESNISSEEPQNITNNPLNTEPQPSNSNINQPIPENDINQPSQDLNSNTDTNLNNNTISNIDNSANIQPQNTVNDPTPNQPLNNQTLSSQDLNSQPIENLPPTNQTTNNNNYNFEPEKKKKNNILPIAIIAVVLIAIVGLIAYKTLPLFQNKFKVMINETFKYLESNISDNENVTGSMTLKMKSNSTEPELKNLEKINFSADYAVDYKNKLLNIDIKSSYDNETLLNASIYGQSKSIYATLEELYDKAIEIPLAEEYDKMFTQVANQKEQKIVLKSLNKALNNSLKENYFTKGKDTVNGNKVDTTTLTINKDNYQTIKEDLINTLLKDKSFLESSAKISDMTTSEIEQNLKDTRDKKEEITGEIKLTVYTKGTTFVKIEAKSEDATISITDNKDQYEYLINNGEESVTGTIKTTGNKEEASINFTMKYNDVTIEITSSAKKGANITQKDTSNTINYAEIPESDLTGILLNLMQSKGLTKFIEDFNLNSSTLEDDYDYDDWSLNDDSWSFTNSNL